VKIICAVLIMSLVSVSNVQATGAFASAIAGHQKSLRELREEGKANADKMFAFEEINAACKDPNHVIDSASISILEQKNLVNGDGEIDALVREACSVLDNPDEPQSNNTAAGYGRQRSSTIIMPATAEEQPAEIPRWLYNEDKVFTALCELQDAAKTNQDMQFAWKELERSYRDKSYKIMDLETIEILVEKGLAYFGNKKYAIMEPDVRPLYKDMIEKKKKCDVQKKMQRRFSVYDAPAPGSQKNSPIVSISED